MTKSVNASIIRMLKYWVNMYNDLKKLLEPKKVDVAIPKVWEQDPSKVTTALGRFYTSGWVDDLPRTTSRGYGQFVNKNRYPA